MESQRVAAYGHPVADVIPFEHIRRSRRLFALLVDQLGLEHFLDSSEERVPRLRQRAVEDAIDLCADWIARRTGRVVNEAALEVMDRQLRRLLILRVAERLL
ncbi:MAG: hypothetical protein ACO3JL_12760 [Myxococcota bacterium]